MSYTNDRSYAVRVDGVVLDPGESLDGKPKKTRKPKTEPTEPPSGDQEQSEEDDQ